MQRLLSSVVLLGFSGFFVLRAETALVLPFFNQSNSENVDWIGESIAENVRESLAAEGVLALDREDRLGGLPPGAPGAHGGRALRSLRDKNAPAEEDFLRARPRVRLDALESYIRGLLAANPEQQRQFFLQAARLGESYSQPCFPLGKSYWRLQDYRAAGPWLARVNPSDPHYLEAQFFRGLCSYQTGDYAAAEKCFETVAATVPLNEVYNDLGAAQARHDGKAAIESFRKAVEGDSADADYHFNLACALWKAGEFRAASDRLRAAMARNAN